MAPCTDYVDEIMDENSNAPDENYKMYLILIIIIMCALWLPESGDEINSNLCRFCDNVTGRYVFG